MSGDTSSHVRVSHLYDELLSKYYNAVNVHDFDRIFSFLSLSFRIAAIYLQVLQQEAYPAIWPLLTPKTRPSLGLPPKWAKTCNLRCGRTAV